MEANVSTYLQYGSAHNLRAFFNAIVPNATIDFDAWYREYFDLRYCGHDGLIWWGEYLGQQPYVTVENTYKNISWVADESQKDTIINSAFWKKNLSPNNFNNGNWYNEQKHIEYFSDEEFRIILINAWLKTYWACTLGNLYDFLNNFFKVSDYNPFPTIEWNIVTITRPNLPEFWWLEYKPSFDADSNRWNSLFTQKKPNGDSIILPVPNDVEWGIRLMEAA